MTYPAPPTRAARKPPSWWWFLAPVVLTILAVIVGAGAFVSMLHTLDVRYGEVRADGEPHAISIPTKDRAMLMVSTRGNAGDWTCRVTDEEGRSLVTSAKPGNVSFSNEASSWQSLLTFDPSAAGSGDQATVYVSCRAATTTPADTVLLAKSPKGSAIVIRVLAMILGPLILGGAAFVSFIVLVILQVTRRTGAAA